MSVTDALRQIEGYTIPLVGLDLAMTLVYCQDYAKTGQRQSSHRFIASEWLAGAPPKAQSVKDAAPYLFLPYCNEEQMNRVVSAFGSMSTCEWG